MGIIKTIKSHRLKKKVSKMTDEQIDKEIIIQGTYFDRKRILTENDVRFAQKMLKKDYTYRQIANMIDVDVRTLRYAIDPEYRLRRISQSNGKHYGFDYLGKSNRIEYKKELVFSGEYVK